LAGLQQYCLHIATCLCTAFIQLATQLHCDQWQIPAHLRTYVSGQLRAAAASLQVDEEEVTVVCSSAYGATKTWVKKDITGSTTCYCQIKQYPTSQGCQSWQ
jgi:hypothetical protein